MCIPVQKYIKFQYKNMYSSTKMYIPVQKYVFQYRNMNIPVQKYVYSSTENIYSRTEIYVPVQKYKFQYRNISSSTETYVQRFRCMESRRHGFEAEFPLHLAVSWREL